MLILSGIVPPYAQKLKLLKVEEDYVYTCMIVDLSVEGMGKNLEKTVVIHFFRQVLVSEKKVVHRHREQGTCMMIYGCVLYISTYILSGLSGRKIPTIITPSALSNAANILGRQ